jgi:hypothetical protein
MRKGKKGWSVMKLRPELLQQPNIPKPLHGVNPRVIMGKDMWDATRKEVYKRQDQRCACCGVHRSEAKYHNWIECHESYSVDPVSGVMVIDELVALCHACHNFIHSGRLVSVVAVFNHEKAVEILEHGLTILQGAGQDINPHTELACTTLTAGVLSRKFKYKASYSYPTVPRPPEIPLRGKQAEWHEFILIYNGVAYRSPLETFAQWEAHYRKAKPEELNPIRVMDLSAPWEREPGPIPRPVQTVNTDYCDPLDLPMLGEFDFH